MKIILLAAGLGSRLGRPNPKPLTRLDNGQRMLERQIALLTLEYSLDDIMVVVGYKMASIIEAMPNLSYAYNPDFDINNTAKSLLAGLRKCDRHSVLWLNGDVVFDRRALAAVAEAVNRRESFLAVERGVADQEAVRYRTDEEGFVTELSKEVVDGEGEAVGINYVRADDRAAFCSLLETCAETDYFEKGIERGIQAGTFRFTTAEIPAGSCVEVDMEDDLARANAIIAADRSHRLAAG